MMTTNLSVIDNVKQLRTGGSFSILLPFFTEHLGALASKFQQFFLIVFTIGLSLARFWRAFGIFFWGGGSLNLPKPNPPPSVRHCLESPTIVFNTCSLVSLSSHTYSSIHHISAYCHLQRHRRVI